MSDLGGLFCLLTTYRQDSPSCKAGVPDQPIGGDVAFSARWPGFVHLRVMGVGHKRSTEKIKPNLFAHSPKGRSSPDVLVGCRPALPGCWRLAKGGQQRFRHPVRCGGNPSLPFPYRFPAAGGTAARRWSRRTGGGAKDTAIPYEHLPAAGSCVPDY